jgi:hypothetical protein
LFINSCLVTLLDAPQTPEAVSVARHKKNADLGKKIVFHYHKIMIEQDDAKRLVDNEEVSIQLLYYAAILESFVLQIENISFHCEHGDLTHCAVDSYGLG